MKLHTQTHHWLRVTAVALGAALGLATEGSAQNQVVMNDNVYLNGVQGANITVTTLSQVSGQFDCTIYSDSDSTNCHTLVVGFRDENNLWAGDQPVVVVQTSAPPEGLALDGVSFAAISPPGSPGTYHLWVDDALPAPTCPDLEEAINCFTTNQPSGVNALQKIIATVTVIPCNLNIPILSAPECGGIIGTTTPVLAWSAVPGASEYMLVLYAGGICDSGFMITNLLLSATSYPVPDSAGLQFGQAYSWRVQARPELGSDYCSSSPSACCSFSVIQPTLGVTYSGANVVISWPTNNGGGFALQSTDLGTNGWTPVGSARVITNRNYQVTLPLTGGAQFYRLKK